MGRYFNTEGLCDPRIHYMVNIDERLKMIKERYVDRGSYFMINRGRQYGKTTTLRFLAEYLKKEYFVFSLDFQELSYADFQNEARFAEGFTHCFMDAVKEAGKCTLNAGPFEKCASLLEGRSGMLEMFDKLSEICEILEKPVVLIIDEVDSASNHQVFIDFLALLRKYYLNRRNKPAFHSVILAGVYDIKNLKLKMRPEKEHQYNSPWNIAAKFDLDMGFSAKQIGAMLMEYEEDNHTGMDISEMAESIYEYTSGYPYLVSAVCKRLDEELPGNEGYRGKSVWTKDGVMDVVKGILTDPSITLFQSMVKHIDEYPDMKLMLNVVLFQGKRITYNPYSKAISLAEMFGYVVNRENSVQVSNRIFEMCLYNFFLSEEELTNAIYDMAQGDSDRFIRDGRLDMRRVLEKFVEYFTDIYGDNDEKSVEMYGRKLFLLYIKPIINGVGNYYIEAQTRDARRTDVIVDYRGERFVIELKIWRGSEYNERGEQQLAGYLDYFHQNNGYLISFNFNKKKERGVKEVMIGDKTILEAVV